MKTRKMLGILVVTFCLINSAMGDWVTSGDNMYSGVSGNVGIGTSTPDTKLDLEGSFRFTDTMYVSNSSHAMNWQVKNEGPGPGPAWFGSFSGETYDARISLTDYAGAKYAKSVFLVQGGETDTDLIIDGRLGLYKDLIVGAPGNWQMKNEGGGPGPFWFGYFSGENYDARFSLTDWTSPAPETKYPKSLYVIQGAGTDTDLVVDGRLGLFGDLVVGPSGTVLLADVATGNVGIGTPTPTQRLHVAGYVLAKGYYTGDLFFQKDGRTLWRMFEDEAGLYVENIASGKKYDVVLRESGSVKSAESDTAVAELKAQNAALQQKMAALEAKLEALAQKLP